MNLSDYEIGWLVGILEGEGHFDFNGYSQKVQVRMYDEDTMMTYTNLVSRFLKCHVDIKYREPGGNKQDVYDVVVCGDNARRLMRLVVPYMHFRRRQKIWQSLNSYKAQKKSSRIDFKALMEASQKEVANDRRYSDQRTPAGQPAAGEGTGRDLEGSVVSDYAPYAGDEDTSVH